MDLLIKVFKSFFADTDRGSVRKLRIPIRNIFLPELADLRIGNIKSGADLEQTHLFINVKIFEKVSAESVLQQSDADC